MLAAAAVACRALVVEDDKSGCEVLAKVLKLFGHEVECAVTVHQALRALERFKPAVVLLDLMLPDGNGAEVLEHIRKHKLPMKVGVVTAAGPRSRDWEEAMKHNPDATFRKPWNLNELKVWLARVSEDEQSR
jgi:CheY-like chemotaxis protein